MTTDRDGKDRARERRTVRDRKGRQRAPIAPPGAVAALADEKRSEAAEPVWAVNGRRWGDDDQ